MAWSKSWTNVTNINNNNEYNDNDVLFGSPVNAIVNNIGYLKDHLDVAESKLTFDDLPIQNSYNAVKSNGVYVALQLLQSSIPTTTNNYDSNGTSPISGKGVSQALSADNCYAKKVNSTSGNPLTLTETGVFEIVFYLLGNRNMYYTATFTIKDLSFPHACYTYVNISDTPNASYNDFTKLAKAVIHYDPTGGQVRVAVEQGFATNYQANILRIYKIRSIAAE